MFDGRGMVVCGRVLRLNELADADCRQTFCTVDGGPKSTVIYLAASRYRGVTHRCISWCGAEEHSLLRASKVVLVSTCTIRASGTFSQIIIPVGYYLQPN